MRSKRQRKKRDNNSLKRKRVERQDDPFAATSLAIGEHEDRDGCEAVVDDCNAVLMLPKKKAKPSVDDGGVEEKKLSKGQQRKLRQVARDKELKAQRVEVLATLAEHSLPDGHLALLKSSAAVGQRETKRQRLAKDLALQRAGMALPDDSELERRRFSSFEASTSTGPEPEPMQVVALGIDADRKLEEAHGRIESSSDDESEAERSDSKLDADEPAGPVLATADIREAARVARKELGLEPLSTPQELTGSGTQSSALNASARAKGGKPHVVMVTRPPEIEESRSQLPIIGMEQEIMEAIAESDVVVLSGETGCGKTTQVPQFLYEAGYGSPGHTGREGMIGVTQPRRVAAIASAQRVATELDCQPGGLVGYQVRYDRQVSDATAIKFMTDGILLREVEADFLLNRYSCLVIDEAHERSLNTDLLIGLLSRIVPLRRKMATEGGASPLTLIIMSATLRTEDFVENARLFSQPPPLIHVPARQFSVTVHFSRRTELHDYTGTAFAKVSQIHRQLPPGGVLVFVTGQREVQDLCKRLRRSLAPKAEAPTPAQAPRVDEAAEQENEEEVSPTQTAWQGAKAQEGGAEDAFGEDAADHDEGEALPAGTDEIPANERDDFDEDRLEDEEEVVVLGGEGFSAEQIAAAEKRFEEQLGVSMSSLTNPVEQGAGPVHVLPLYAMLPRAAQARVFQAVPEGHRLIVVATNVAETSLTIPGIRYVVDAGRAKQKLLENGSGMARFEVGWISKASAEQRAGRAGRTGPGHCYRLFSSAVYNDDFLQHSPPEVLNTALEGVVLVMKTMGIEKVDNFPFPTPPEAAALKTAQRCLEALGAIHPGTGGLTQLGRAMAGFPIGPRHARMLLQVYEDAKSHAAVLPHAVALAAATSVESPFAYLDNIQAERGNPEAGNRERQSARAAHNRLRSRESDSLSALTALSEYEAADNPGHFCRSHHLHARNLAEMAALHAQLRRVVAQRLWAVPALDSPLHRASPAIMSALRKAMAAGWTDQVARRVRAAEHISQQVERSGKKRAVRYRAANLNEEIFLHPQSALYSAAPEFVIYTQLVRSTKRPYMAGVTEIDAHWLADVDSPLCTISPPLEDPPPQYAAKQDAVVAWHDVTFGKHLWQLPRLRRLHPNAVVRTRVFAAALLGGTVLPSFAGLSGALVAPASLAAKLEGLGHPRVSDLVSALQRKSVDSRATLAAAWRRDVRYLRTELAAWMKKGRAAELEAVWPRLLEDAAARSAGKKKGRAVKC